MQIVKVKSESEEVQVGVRVGTLSIFEFSLNTSLIPMLYPCAAQNEGKRTTTMILAARDNCTVCPILADTSFCSQVKSSFVVRVGG
jgi:hypothetical protein